MIDLEQENFLLLSFVPWFFWIYSLITLFKYFGINDQFKEISHASSTSFSLQFYVSHWFNNFLISLKIFADQIAYLLTKSYTSFNLFIWLLTEGLSCACCANYHDVMNNQHTYAPLSVDSKLFHSKNLKDFVVSFFLIWEVYQVKGFRTSSPKYATLAYWLFWAESTWETADVWRLLDLPLST